MINNGNYSIEYKIGMTCNDWQSWAEDSVNASMIMAITNYAICLMAIDEVF